MDAAGYRRALHAIPELGFDLPETQAYVEDALRGTGAAVERLQPAGLLVYFDAGKPDTCAFRADMDALPVAETSGVPFASKHPGVMHACGHDAHMAVLLALAQALPAMRAELPVNVLLIFQPAEELGTGARMICESGALERYHVRRVFALHVMPGYPKGAICVRPGALMAQSMEIHVSVTGRALHIARWREGADAVAVAADYLTRVYAMTEALRPEEPKLLRFGVLRGGEIGNVVAGSARLDGTLRAFDEATFYALRDGSEAIGADCEAAYGVRFAFSYTPPAPFVNNDPALLARCVAAFDGLRVEQIAERSMLSEDFAHYQRRVPGVLFWLGIGDAPALHASRFDLDDGVLETAVEAFRRLCLI